MFFPFHRFEVHKNVGYLRTAEEVIYTQIDLTVLVDFFLEIKSNPVTFLMLISSVIVCLTSLTEIFVMFDMTRHIRQVSLISFLSSVTRAEGTGLNTFFVFGKL